MIDWIDYIPPENIYLTDPTRRKELPFFDAAVQAGFPNPADNYIRQRLNLQDLCVLHPDNTYFVKATGNTTITFQRAAGTPNLLLGRSIVL